LARFDVFRSDGDENLLLVVQSDLLSPLNTVVVVPLLPARNAPLPARDLNPRFVVDGDDYVMTTQFLSAVPRSVLKHCVGNLGLHHVTIVRALDLLLQGF
jgi:toxin CcdB